MLRFGIYSLQQLYSNQLTDIFGKEKNIAIELYAQLQESGVAYAEQYEETVLGHFKFGQIFKRTHSDRFSAFDRSILFKTQERFGQSPGNPVSIHDLAASDGRTSLELYKTFSTLYQGQFVFVASDLLPWVNLVTSPRCRSKVITDDNGRVLQIIHPPFVFDLGRREGKFYWVDHVIQKCLVKRAELLSSLFMRKSTEVQVKKIVLISKRCRELAQCNSNFTFERHDIFEPTKEQFCVVRAMNILNPRYFNSEQTARILGAVFSSMRLGGLFATGSNEGQGSEVQGAIYSKEAEGFRLLVRASSGSAVDALIEGFVPCALKDQS